MRRTQWLDLREAIELVGPMLFPDEWTGHESWSPTQRELDAELARLSDLTPRQIVQERAALRARLDRQVNQERAAMQARGEKPSGLRDALETLREKFAGEPDPAKRRAFGKMIDRVSAELAKAQEPKPQPRLRAARSEADFITDVLANDIVGAYQPGLAARGRWLEAHVAIHHAGQAGRIRARADRPALPPVLFGVERWTEIFPPAGENRAVVEGIPARITLAKADLEEVFAAAILHPPEPSPEPERTQPRRSHHPTRDRAFRRMTDAIASGAETLERLRAMPQEALAEFCDVSRETAQLALSELVARQTATSSD